MSLLITKGLGLGGTGTGEGTVLVEGLTVTVVDQALLEIAVTFDVLDVSVELLDDEE